MSGKQIESQYDAVIVGAGAAGLSAALAYLAGWQGTRRPKLLVFSKLEALRSHTGSAEGGIAASLGNEEKDDWHWHYFDTVKGGDWLVDQDAAKILAQEATGTVVALEHAGVAFSRSQDGHIAQRRFGGHTSQFGKQPVKRAAYAADRIGHQILTSLWQQCVRAGVDFAEEWYVCDLALDPTGHSVEGLVALDTHEGHIHAIQASQVIICSGGAGRLFHTTSNSWDLTGDGMSLALRAGLQLEDMEFIQFHPTGLAHTGILLSEASRAEGGVLRNAQGEAFMGRYAPEQADLAARDVVSRAILEEVRQGRGVADPREPDGPKDCVWLDLRAISPEDLEAKLPQVAETIRFYAGLDPSRDLVPVKPTAHYMMGGIPISTQGQVYRWKDGCRQPIAGLYAAGECSCVGVHGANRLGGNSLLDACLFGHRSGLAAANQSQERDQRAGDNSRLERLAQERSQQLKELFAQAQAQQTITTKAADQAGRQGQERQEQQANAYQLIDRIGALLDRCLAVSCDADSIQSALEQIEGELLPAANKLSLSDPSKQFNQELTAILEAGNLALLAQCVLRASLNRQESRGSLFRRDYPQRNDQDFLKHSLLDMAGQRDWQDVHILDFPPGSRGY
ncbi:succinate dehydrogenase flavoprotein subunit [Bombiscardovia nodaiensis]|uniref:succinate dehydrogenase n=1 Tax=Bombiscardovia nodaiensis TaxID=2932181 RepID=A0ABN6SBK3_9BIFI|nr:succinate dehydrogenase flavoprotein subunit [Bombiscardovia nodaiensis]